MEKTEDFAQLQLLFTDPIQHDYEAIRPVVLFGQAIADRGTENHILSFHCRTATNGRLRQLQKAEGGKCLTLHIGNRATDYILFSIQ